MDQNQIFFEFMNYIWKYFELHANQRITLFKFYTGFCTIFISAIGYIFTRFHQESSKEVAISILALSAFLILITWIFQCLDNRNRQLIHYAEDSLRHLEEQVQANINPIPSIDIKEIKIFTKERQEKNSGNSLAGHTECFKRLFYCSYIIGSVLLILALCKLGATEWLWHRLI